MADQRFCDALERATTGCKRCVEFDERGVCDIELGKEPILGERFGIYDVIMLNRTKRGDITVETDITVDYRSKFDYVRQWDSFLSEMDVKEKALGEKLKALISPEVQVLRFHRHHYPNFDPNRVALHTHLFYRATNVTDAVRVAKHLVQTVKPRELSKELEGRG